MLKHGWLENRWVDNRTMFQCILDNCAMQILQRQAFVSTVMSSQVSLTSRKYFYYHNNYCPRKNVCHGIIYVTASLCREFCALATQSLRQGFV